MANGNFGGGDGTFVSPYLVEDAADLDAVRNGLTLHYKQIKDIDASSLSNFKPIGSLSASAFSGAYDGGGYVISNINIRESVIQQVGFFGRSTGVHKNTHLKNADIRSLHTSGLTNVWTGGFVGNTAGAFISGCSIQGTVQGVGSFTGGFVGNVSGGKDTEISSCFSDCSTFGSSLAGGFVGSCSYLDVSDCYSSGRVVGQSSVGGFAGVVSSGGVIKRCFSSGAVEGVSSIGGFVGVNNQQRSNVVKSYALAPYVARLSGTSLSCGSFLGSGDVDSSNFALSTMEFRG